MNSSSKISLATLVHARLRAPAGAFARALAVVALLASCGGGGGGGGGSPAPAEPDGGTPALKASQPGDLTAYAQRLLRERAAARRAGAAPSDSGRSVAPVPLMGAAPSTASATFSTSLTQEAGVDEPDLVKTDGRHLFSLDTANAAGALLRSTRRTDTGALEERAALPLARGNATAFSPRGLMLSSDGRALAVASEAWVGVPGDPCVDFCASLLPPGPVWMRSLVGVERVDVSDPARLSATTKLEFDGRLIDARRVGHHLVLVSEYQPMLAADQLPLNATAAEREAAIAATRGGDLLPRRHLPGGEVRALLSDTDCWVQPANASLAMAVTTITVLDLRAADFAPASRCFVGGSESLYMTPQSLYIASTRWSYFQAGALRYPQTMLTDIHKFALDAANGGLQYRGSGEVAGHLGWDAQRKSYRLSEHEGVLRVLSFTGSVGWASAGDAASGTPPSPATLTLLAEPAGGTGALQVLATLPNASRPQPLGKPGEQVHGVRFVGARGYLVTFRQIDPLYVLELGNASDPRIAGVLEAPGFSDHLLPLPGELLLGVGREADVNGRVAGVKVALFDVADAARPRELATRTFGSSGSQSGLDQSRQGLTLLQQGSTLRIATPLLLFDAGFTNARDGLQRLEVDLTARTLLSKALIVPPSPSPFPSDLASQRSVLIGEQAYWLRSGRLSAHAW